MCRAIHCIAILAVMLISSLVAGQDNAPADKKPEDKPTEKAQTLQERIAADPRVQATRENSLRANKYANEAWKALQDYTLDPSENQVKRIEESFAALREQAKQPYSESPLHAIYKKLGELEKHPFIKPTDKLWQAQLELYDRWHKDMPKSSAALLAKAGLLISYAWDARGTGFADSVTEDNFRKFRDRIEQAEKVLDEAEQLNDPDPQYYVHRINCEQANGGDPDKVWEYVKKSAKDWGEYHPTYTAAAWFFLPRWHGEPGDCEKLANDLYDRLGGDTGKMAFCEVLLHVHGYDPGTLLNGKYDPQKLRESLLWAHKHGLSPVWMKLMTEVAWRTQDVELARVALEDLDLIEPGKKPTDLSYFASQALAKSGQSDFGKRVLWLPLPQLFVSEIDFSPSSQMLAVSTGKTGYRAALLADLKTDRFVGSAPADLGVGRFVRYVGTDHDRVLIGATIPKAMRLILFDSLAPEKTVEFEPLSESFTGIQISRSGKFVSGLSGKAVVVCDATTGKKTWEFVPEKTGIRRVLISPDDKRLVAVYDGKLAVYDLASQALEYSLGKDEEMPGSPRYAAGFDKEGRLVVDLLEKVEGVNDKASWQFFDLQSRKLTPCVPKETQASICRITTNGRYLVSLINRLEVVVVDLETKKETFRRKMQNGAFYNAAVSPDGATVACLHGSGVVLLFDVARPKE